MPFFFIDASGNYYETLTDIPTPDGQRSVPQRPDPWATWDGGQWQAGSPPPDPVPTQITFAQLLIGLVAEGWITEAEGDAWLEGRIPAAALALIGTLPQAQRFAAKARAARPSVVLRNDPLVTALATAQGRADELDRFFTTYAAV